MQTEYRFAAISNHVDMGRSVVIEINHHPQPANP